MAYKPKLGGKALTTELRKLAAEAHTTDDQGNTITREQRLAQMIWDLALGARHFHRDVEGNGVWVETKPVAWAQQFLFERMEGKAVAIQTDNEGGVKAAEKVRELAKSRLNEMAAKALKPAVSGPPKYRPQGNV